MHSEFFSLVARQERLVATGELGCFPKLVLCDAGLIAVTPRVVVQLFPRARMGLATQAQEAAKRGDGIDHVATALLDHEALDRANRLPVRVVNSCSLKV